MTESKRGLIRSSTREFYQEGKKTTDYSLFDFLHGYMYSRWPYLYISVALGEHRLHKVIQPIFLFMQSIMEPTHEDELEEFGNGWANSYHGKVVPIDEAKRLGQLEHPNIVPALNFVNLNAVNLKNGCKIGFYFFMVFITFFFKLRFSNLVQRNDQLMISFYLLSERQIIDFSNLIRLNTQPMRIMAQSFTRFN